MADTPEAAGEVPQAPQTEQTPTQVTNHEPAQAPDMHGFTSEQLAEMRKFYDANGGFDKVKSKISNPDKPVEKPVENSQPQANEPTSQSQAQPVEAPRTPKGAITRDEWLAKEYFKSLSTEEKYSNISDGIRSGEYLKEMAAFGIQPLNQDGSINDEKVRMYLDLKSQTVPAKATGTEPDASSAPTVNYVEVGEKIENIDQAYQVLMQPGHAKMAEAEEFIRKHLNPNSQAEK